MKPEYKKYYQNGNEFLAFIKSIMIDKNFASSLSMDIPDVLSNEHMPNDITIKAMYIEVFTCHYLGLHNSSISVGVSLLEYMSKKLYSNMLNTPYLSGNWEPVLNKLKSKLKSNNELSIIIDNVNIIRKQYRNSQNHGNLIQLVNDNFKKLKMLPNIVDGVCQTELADMDVTNLEYYHPELKITQNIASANILWVITVFIVAFFIVEDHLTS